MSAVSVSATDVSRARTAAEHYLLLGELRGALEETEPSEGTNRWLLAVLDRLLAYLPHSVERRELQCGWPDDPSLAFWCDSASWWQKLQRLRDRVVHQAPFQILANEIRCDLKRLLDQRAAAASL